MPYRLTAILQLAVCCGILALTHPALAAEFSATGPTKETKLDPARFLGAVQVTFDPQPTTMSFDLPWHFCPVAENGFNPCPFFVGETARIRFFSVPPKPCLSLSKIV